MSKARFFLWFGKPEICNQVCDGNFFTFLFLWDGKVTENLDLTFEQRPKQMPPVTTLFAIFVGQEKCPTNQSTHVTNTYFTRGKNLIVAMFANFLKLFIDHW